MHDPTSNIFTDTKTYLFVLQLIIISKLKVNQIGNYDKSICHVSV